MLIEVPGCERKIQHLPIGSLKLFGITPYDEAIFRVVWSESRYYLVGAAHNTYDGDPSVDSTVRMRGKDPNLWKTEVGYKWLPLYPSIKAWILECWKSPIGFTGCTLEQWNTRYCDPQTGLMTLGPYPSRGEYSQCFTFSVTPEISIVHRKIGEVKAGWNYSYNEHKAAVDETEKKKEKDNTAKLEDIFLDSQQAFKNRPSNIRPGKRTKDHIKFKYTERDLNLRRGFSTLGRRH